MTFEIRLDAGSVPHRSLVITPNDVLTSLTLNGQEVALSDSHSPLFGSDASFVVPVGDYLVPGDNVAVAVVMNHRGGGGLDLRPYLFDPVHAASGLVALLALGALLVDVMLGLGCVWPTIAVTAAALGERTAYLGVTPYNVRQHDVGGHLEYIDYLVAHHALPSPNAGFLFYHPPLYYLLAALQSAALTAAGVGRAGVLEGLQLQSMAYELGFAAFAAATARLWLDRLPAGAFGKGLTSRRGLNALVAALMLLWPSSVVHAVRIGNDDLAYLFFGAGLYFASRWWLSGRDRDLGWAAVAAGLGVVTKTNDLLVFAVVAVAFVGRLGFVERQRRLAAYVRRGALVAGLMVASSAIALGTALRDFAAGVRPHLLIANADMTPAQLAVGNDAKNYLWLDLRGFVWNPFTSAWDDALGRQWFWHYVLKTSLFGEFSFGGAWCRGLAVAASVLLVDVVAVLVAGVVMRRARDWVDTLPLDLAVGLCVVSLVLLRMSLPRACTGDFRYILPVVGGCACAYVLTLSRWHARGWPRVATATAGLGWAFLATTVAFFAGAAVAPAV
jgi:hypothetical protein